MLNIALPSTRGKKALFGSVRWRSLALCTRGADMSATIKENDTKPTVLTGTQALVLISLISGKKKKEAAEAAGVHPQAVSEMLTQKHFVEALQYSQGKLQIGRAHV